MATASGATQIEGLAVTSSVIGIDPGVPGQPQRASAYEIARRLLSVHPGYAQGRGRNLAQPTDPGQREQTLGDWLREIRPFFIEQYVPEINGRVLLLGLAMADRPLGTTLLNTGVLDALVAEMATFYEGERRSRTRDVISSSSGGARPSKHPIPFINEPVQQRIRSTKKKK